MSLKDAEVVKLVDTQVSGACGGNPVEVRVLFSAPLLILRHIPFLFDFSWKKRFLSVGPLLSKKARWLAIMMPALINNQIFGFQLVDKMVINPYLW